eukprot:3249040-Rhodomonas_salina.1
MAAMLGGAEDWDSAIYGDAFDTFNDDQTELTEQWRRLLYPAEDRQCYSIALLMARDRQRNLLLSSTEDNPRAFSIINQLCPHWPLLQ